MLKFLVDVKHVRGVAAHEKTDHLFTVQEAAMTGMYVNAADFGCSRTYRTKDPKVAISLFLSEHACTSYNVRLVTETEQF